MYGYICTYKSMCISQCACICIGTGMKIHIMCIYTCIYLSILGSAMDNPGIR